VAVVSTRPATPRGARGWRTSALYLAWWRTGLTAFAVSLGTGKLVPALTDETRWPYVVVGVGFALLGMVFVAYGFRRERLVERAVARGHYVRPDERLLAALTAIGVRSVSRCC
jgi:putative membrane protein